MSIAYNNIKRSVAPKSIFESAQSVVTSAVNCNQGDLIAFDTTNKRIKAVTATTDGANILGVAKQTLVNGKAKSPYIGTAVDASGALSDVPGPVYGVIAELTLKTGDAINPGDALYLSGTDPQLVTVTDPGDGMSIGTYQGAAIASAPAGQKIEVLVGARFGLSGLHF